MTFPGKTADSVKQEPASDELVFDVQPGRQSIIWQHNDVTEFRYKLTLRQQKLLWYAIAMIDPGAEEFGKIKISVQHFASLTGLDTDNLYRELRQTALAIREAPLVVDHVLEPGMRKPQRRHSSWFEYVDEVPDGSGFVTVKFTSWLKPYLLQVRRHFFYSQLGFGLNLQTEYGGRLYPILKRWEFAKRRTFTVDELRLAIGSTRVDSKGKIIQILLEQYKHFKSRALTSAIEDINRETDLFVTFIETKVRGSKAVHSITFVVNKNFENLDRLEMLSLPDRAQLEFPLSEQEQGTVIDLEATRALSEIAGEFGLTKAQERGLHTYVAREGLQYLLDKAKIVGSQPRTNAAKAFLAAVRDDWQPPKAIERPSKAKQKDKQKEAAEEPTGWREWVEREYPKAEIPPTFRELQAFVPTVARECKEALNLLAAANK